MSATQGPYDIGDIVRMRATYVSTDFVTTADPSVISFLVMSGAGTVSTYQYSNGGGSITRVGTGLYYKDITVDVYGVWAYRTVGTGGVQAAEEWHFNVNQSRFAL